MAPTPYPNHCVHWYISELTSHIVADSGIPSDRHHMGKIVLQSLRDAQDYEFQIDGATGERESSGSVLARSVRCARALTRSGLRAGDVMALMAPNHIHLAIPFYAALYQGITVSCVDRTFGTKELQKSFAITRPKIVFCQSVKESDVKLVLEELSLNCQIVTFDKGGCLYFGEFIEKGNDIKIEDFNYIVTFDEGNVYTYFGEILGKENDIKIEDFKATNFVPEETLALLIPTSGTTGEPKCASLTHKNLAVSGPYWFWERYTKFPSPSRMGLVTSPIQWFSAVKFLITAPIFRTILLLTSKDSITREHVIELIKTYRPTFTVFNPSFLANILHTKKTHEECDFSCFEAIFLSGSGVSKDLLEKIKIRAPKANVYNCYGMTETSGYVFCGGSNSTASLVDCGKPMGFIQARIIDTDSGKDITEPFIKGELWLRGPNVFVGYCNNTEDTKKTMTEDGWLKTGDMFHRDENWNYFYVERIKLLLKYKNHQISPFELESVILKHPSVLDIAISSIPDELCGDLPVACVVLKDGNKATAQEIKDIIKENLSDSKQLRGGVIFMEKLPLTPSTKINRRQLKEMVLTMDRE